ncbi:hypothetical protein Lal_00031990, partial [Lupinus albus]
TLPSRIFFQIYSVSSDWRLHIISFYMKGEALMTDYQQQFEKLCNKIWGLNHEVILKCSIYGLTPEF